MEKLPPSGNENLTATPWDSLSDLSQPKVSYTESTNHNYEPTPLSKDPGDKEDSQPEVSYTENISHNYESTPLSKDPGDKEDSQPEVSYTGAE